MFKKRGVSEVVATVLIILVVVAAVAILWAVVIPLIQNQIASTEGFDIDLRIDKTAGYTFLDLDDQIAYVRVTRGGDDYNLSAIKFIFSSEGNSVSLNTTGMNEDVPNPNQAKVYSFFFDVADGWTEAKLKELSLKIVPIFVDGREGIVVSELESFGLGEPSLDNEDNDGDETTTSDDTTTTKVGSTGGSGGGCTPNCAGKSCGDDGCGGSCGSCASGEECNGGVCCDDACRYGFCGSEEVFVEGCGCCPKDSGGGITFPGSSSEICDDGIDNDDDGYTDCADEDCDGLAGNLDGKMCEYNVELSCDDGFDNDADGGVDCYDLDMDCYGAPGPDGTPCE